MGRVYGLTAQARRARLEELLNLYELEPIRRRMAGVLSGGQRQRLGLAAATIHDPDLLFLDEPTSAVDPESRRQFWEQLFDLCNAGKTILVSTHYMDEAERCHGLAILDAGSKCGDGSPQQLMDAMDAQVVEVEHASGDLRQTKSRLLQLPEVVSAAQLGSRLRVLVSNQIDDPTDFLARHLDASFSLNAARPSLEDVFVTITGRQHESA